MIQSAYAVRPFLVQGLPPWAKSAFYDVNAVLERQGPADIGKPENFKLLQAGVQGLLEDRFHLRFHHETQQRAGFRLLTTKGGLKAEPPAKPDGPTYTTSRMFKDHKVVEYGNQTMAHIAAVFSLQFNHPVIDATGVEGRYDFKIQLEPDQTDSSRYLSDALNRFGLRLEAAKLDTDVFRD